MNDFTKKLKESDGLRRFVEGLLDKIDRTGTIPNTYSQRLAAKKDADSVKWFFGPLNVKIKGDKICLHLNKISSTQAELIASLYKAAGRSRRNLKKEKNVLAGQVEELVKKFVPCESAVFAGYLHAELEKLQNARGELFAIARQRGLNFLAVYLESLQRGFKFLSADSQAVRLSRFGLEVNGDTKSCRPGTSFLKTFARLLYLFSPEIKAEVDLSEPQNESDKLRLTLEQTRLQLDGSANQFQVYGNLVFAKNDERFAYVKKHAQLGEPVVLTWAQLENAQIVEVSPKIVTIENETTFYEYAQTVDPSLELVICTMGQANRLLVKFLERIKPLAASFYHWGDLDRSGVLILDSLARRSGCDIQPLRMDVKTFLANIDKGQALPDEEKNRLQSLLQRRPDIICNDLLKSIFTYNLWVEQENILPGLTL